MGWHRILPNGIILGYNDEISIELTSDVLDDFTLRFPTTGTLSTDEITTMWINSNIKKNEEFINQDHQEYGMGAQNYYRKTVYIVGNKYFYIKNCQVSKKSSGDKIICNLKVDKSNIKSEVFKR